MRKTLCIVIFGALALLLVGVRPAAAKIAAEITYTPGTIRTDSITWRASGSVIPGTLGVRVDTVVAGSDDTSSTAFDLGGCVWAAATFVFSDMGANLGTGVIGITTQTGPDPAGGLWISQSMVASPAGAPAQLDTVTQILIQSDSLLTGQLTGNFRTQNRIDYGRARTHRIVRFIITSTRATNDTTMIKGVITRIW